MHCPKKTTILYLYSAQNQGKLHLNCKEERQTCDNQNTFVNTNKTLVCLHSSYPVGRRLSLDKGISITAALIIEIGERRVQSS